MPFPNIDPIAIHIGPFAVHWYGIAYVVGILGWWRYSLWLSDKYPNPSRKDIDDFIVWAVFGVVLGGRLGYVLFYKPDYYFSHPLEILQTWHGGMSFHGGLLGVIVTIAFFARKRGMGFLDFSDVACCGVPIGLFFGRIANFLNGELFGRITDSSWGVIFPHGGPLPRHPSQLYEAFFEGALLFFVMTFFATKSPLGHRRGFLTGLFLAGYAVARITAEFFREPDAFLGFFAGGVTMGQILSLPALAFGLFLMIRTRQSHVAP
ncbi:Prolipoprotein diacylglyceryl transferase [Candidatus Bealeia paramacronuclearis]|uniref:Phosphatidylglycerol--prolipoprotein diacylglyceryl transferase n=1 Tax=Candidatus Bealeia paramacronuclearis TaxID=1921001 RepID=A0ABZ2C2T5_9PROT|nr:Prolipoprotein diacylglyceryl transferase [Candidatus Bealeia paramacronuclearis]